VSGHRAGRCTTCLPGQRVVLPAGSRSSLAVAGHSVALTPHGRLPLCAVLWCCLDGLLARHHVCPCLAAASAAQLCHVALRAWDDCGLSALHRGIVNMGRTFSLSWLCRHATDPQHQFVS
jgi:hypothetical protein